MKTKTRFCCFTMALTFMSSILVTPTIKTRANENSYGIVTEEASPISSSGLQADITFPDYLNYVDDTLIVNNMYTFKVYKGQGKLYITCSDGLQNVRVFINGKEINVSDACRNNGKTYEIDFSDISENDRNTIQVTNFVPETGKVNIKIPYPEVIEGSADLVGVNQNTLDLIDTLINNDIKYGFTSAQLAVIKDGVMIKNSAYGNVNSYNQDGTSKTDSAKVTTETLYDLASNTKMYSTNYAIQKLVSDGVISISDKITKFFPDFIDGESNPIKGKANLTIQNILEHQAGFPADPQYHNNKFNQATQKSDQNVENPLYSQDKTTTKEMILKTPLQYEPGTKTVYSDVDYMLLGLIVEKVTGMDLDTYVENTFYKPLELDSIVYNPLKKGFSKENIAATELNGNSRDGAISFENIRDYTLQGEVHDEKAYYSMNGVSGHAGLFANASDLAKLAQVMLNDGGYGNNKFFSKNIVEEFTKRKSSSPTWGLGWWREGDNGRLWYFGTQSSSNTFGHQGWTGTLTVIDPESNLVIVLLTNKINSPLVDNTINANAFLGNQFTTSTLGTIPTLVYESIIHNNDDAVDANLSQMASESMKLYEEYSNSYLDEAILKSAYSMVDTVISKSEERKTLNNLAYAEEAVKRLDAERDREVIIRFNERIKNLGGTPVKLPDYSSEIKALNDTINQAKEIFEKGQDLEEHVYYQTSAWDKFTQAYEKALDVYRKGDEANSEELITANEELEAAKKDLVKLDKTNLNKVIEDANTRVKEGILENLTEEDKSSFINALEAAKDVYDNKDVSIQDIAKAYNDILIQYKEIGIPVGDKYNLSDLINMAEAINLDRFLNKGQEEFKNSLKSAKDILEVEDAAEIDVYKVYEALYNSMMNLELKADKTKLYEAITESEKINLNLYTENSKAGLLSAIEAAKLIKANSEATQEEVDSALENINNAVNDLVKAADKSDLVALVKKADAVDINKYKDESGEVFSKALNEAKYILSDKNISFYDQEFVNIVYNNLKKAIDGLELKETSNGNAGNGSSNEEDDKKDTDDSTKNNNSSNDNNDSAYRKGDSNLPSTGGDSPIIYMVIGIISIVIGLAVFRNRKIEE